MALEEGGVGWQLGQGHLGHEVGRDGEREEGELDRSHIGRCGGAARGGCVALPQLKARRQGRLLVGLAVQRGGALLPVDGGFARQLAIADRLRRASLCARATASATPLPRVGHASSARDAICGAHSGKTGTTR